MEKRMLTVSRLLLALPFVIFGLNKFLMFANMPPPEGQQAQAFLGAMFTSYLVQLVGATEILAGLLLLSRRTAFLGSLILLPVTVNIAAFHFAHDMPGNGIWLVTTALHLLIIYLQRAHWLGLILGLEDKVKAKPAVPEYA